MDHRVRANRDVQRFIADFGDQTIFGLNYRHRRHRWLAKELSPHFDGKQQQDTKNAERERGEAYGVLSACAWRHRISLRRTDLLRVFYLRCGVVNRKISRAMLGAARLGSRIENQGSIHRAFKPLANAQKETVAENSIWRGLEPVAMPVIRPALEPQSMQVLPGFPAGIWLKALKASTRNWPLMPSLMGMFFSSVRSSLKKDGPVKALREDEPN